MKARLTHDTEFVFKMDPYVFIRYKDRTERTSVIQGGGKNPIWNQTFYFDVDSMHDLFEFFVMDKDTFTPDDTIGFMKLTV